jgi:hypothetical protein
MMRIRQSFPVFMLLILALDSTAQPMSSVIKTQAAEMGRAMVRQDAEAFSKFMHPSVVKMAGGPAKVREMSDTLQKIFKQFGGSITRVLFGNPGDILRHNNTWQTTLPQTTFISTAFADIEVTSTLLALSVDKGQHWFFIDTSVYSEDSLRKEMPQISPELTIPPPAKPRITPKNQ